MNGRIHWIFRLRSIPRGALATLMMAPAGDAPSVGLPRALPYTEDASLRVIVCKNPVILQILVLLIVYLR